MCRNCCAHQTFRSRTRVLFLQDIEEALKRLPQKEVEARNARLKRAMDLNFKHAELPPEIQALQDPFKPYLSVSCDTDSMPAMHRWIPHRPAPMQWKSDVERGPLSIALRRAGQG